MNIPLPDGRKQLIEQHAGKATTIPRTHWLPEILRYLLFPRLTSSRRQIEEADRRPRACIHLGRIDADDDQLWHVVSETHQAWHHNKG